MVGSRLSTRLRKRPNTLFTMETVKSDRSGLMSVGATFLTIGATLPSRDVMRTIRATSREVNVSDLIKTEKVRSAADALLS